MFTLLSWNEENIFDLNGLNMILISLLKLQRKYIIIWCSVYFLAGVKYFYTCNQMEDNKKEY
jgi:putative exporter of polyketide antibiotics